jgi:hypothetical protein
LLVHLNTPYIWIYVLKLFLCSVLKLYKWTKSLLLRCSIFVPDVKSCKRQTASLTVFKKEFEFIQQVERTRVKKMSGKVSLICVNDSTDIFKRPIKWRISHDQPSFWIAFRMCRNEKSAPALLYLCSGCEDLQEANGVCHCVWTIIWVHRKI